MIRSLILIVVGLLTPEFANAQNCRAANDSSYDMIEMIKSYTLATDSIVKATRDSLRLPALDAPLTSRRAASEEPFNRKSRSHQSSG